MALHQNYQKISQVNLYVIPLCLLTIITASIPVSYCNSSRFDPTLLHYVTIIGLCYDIIAAGILLLLQLLTILRKPGRLTRYSTCLLLPGTLLSISSIMIWLPTPTPDTEVYFTPVFMIFFCVQTAASLALTLAPIIWRKRFETSRRTELHGRDNRSGFAKDPENAIYDEAWTTDVQVFSVQDTVERGHQPELAEADRIDATPIHTTPIHATPPTRRELNFGGNPAFEEDIEIDKF